MAENNQIGHYSCSRFNRTVHACTSLFTARCYAERGYPTVCRLSVCLSVRLSV